MFALPVPARVLLPILAFGAIGLAVLPADLSAVKDVKTAAVSPARPAPSFNVTPMPTEAINKAPVMSTPVPLEQSVAAPTAVWRPAWVTAVTPSSSIEPANLTLDTVNSAVNVRVQGQKGSPVLFVLPAGAEVRIAENVAGWVHIYSDQGAGWIFSSYVGARAAPEPGASDASASGRTIRVAGTVTVRDAPDGDPVYKLEAGEPIQILETDGNWARIATSAGEGGWVRVR